LAAPEGLRLAFVAARLATIPVGMVVGELMLLIVFSGSSRRWQPCFA